MIERRLMRQWIEAEASGIRTLLSRLARKIDEQGAAIMKEMDDLKAAVTDIGGDVVVLNDEIKVYLDKLDEEIANSNVAGIKSATAMLRDAHTGFQGTFQTLKAKLDAVSASGGAATTTPTQPPTVG